MIDDRYDLAPQPAAPDETKNPFAGLPIVESGVGSLLPLSTDPIVRGHAQPVLDPLAVNPLGEPSTVLAPEVPAPAAPAAPGKSGESQGKSESSKGKSGESNGKSGQSNGRSGQSNGKASQTHGNQNSRGKSRAPQKPKKSPPQHPPKPRPWS